MKNKNLLWIVAGVGAGVFAFYLFCKKEQVQYEIIEEINEDGELETKSVPVGGGGGGFFAGSPSVGSFTTDGLTPPVTLTTAIPTTNINIVPSVPSTPTVTPSAPSSPTVTAVPIPITNLASPTTSPSSPTTSPTIITSTKPTSTAVTSPTPKPIATLSATNVASKFSGFDGGGDCFEVGEKLNDLY